MRPAIILIADEDVSLANAIIAECESEGWQAFAVFTGDQTIKLFHERKPDLIVLNTILPGVSGVEVCRHIAAVSKTPVIMLGGVNDGKMRAKCIRYGAGDYVVKPFQTVELMQRINKFLIRKQVKTGERRPTLGYKRKYLQECIDGLRSKIERDPENPAFIVTVPGIGYKFEIPEKRATIKKD